MDLLERPGPVFEHLWIHLLKGLPVGIEYDDKYIHLVSKVLIQMKLLKMRIDFSSQELIELNSYFILTQVKENA